VARRTTVPSVKSFDTKARPPSSWAAALTICGTTTALSRPVAMIA
jgi:hypothetical protein